MGVLQHLGPLGASRYTSKLNSLACLVLLVLLSLLSVHLRAPTMTCETSTRKAGVVSTS